jgi:hypothetical protein
MHLDEYTGISIGTAFENNLRPKVQKGEQFLKLFGLDTQSREAS